MSGGVSEVVVYADRVELRTAEELRVVRFIDIARWPRPVWLWKLLSKIGVFRGALFVADRDWFHPMPEKFFAFYTAPPIVVYMPEDGRDGYHESDFLRVQEVMRQGRLRSFDLGISFCGSSVRDMGSGLRRRSSGGSARSIGQSSTERMPSSNPAGVRSSTVVCRPPVPLADLIRKRSSSP